MVVACQDTREVLTSPGSEGYGCGSCSTIRTTMIGTRRTATKNRLTVCSVSNAVFTAVIALPFVLQLQLQLHPCTTTSVVEAFQTSSRPLHLQQMTVTTISRNRNGHQHQYHENRGGSMSQSSPSSGINYSLVTLSMAGKGKLSPDDIKSELTRYLQVREEAKQSGDNNGDGEVRKTVGGTRGNVVLEFVSGAPVKEWVIDQPSNLFDYDELSKYGFSHLVTPIMDIGGRPAAYKLMDMPVPSGGRRPELEKKSAPKLVIDRTGENDKARYSGLKINQVLDDDLMAEALERKRTAAAAVGRPKLMEETFERPFSDKRNTGPKQTPDWTVERLDEWGKQQGRAQEWARRAKMGEFVKDPFEIMDLPLTIRLYTVATLWLIAVAYGRSTPTFLVHLTSMIDTSDQAQQLMGSLEIPALALGLSNLGSALVCSVILAPQKNRNAFVWCLKGLCGGPIAVRQLSGLDQLITFQDQANRSDESKDQL